jgi:PKD repeat protein
MRCFFSIFLFLLIPFLSFSQEITRGPEIGEIYFMGPTTTVLHDAIYRSTDFGETAICMDSVSALTYNIGSIAADKTPGGLYYSNNIHQLYFSSNYGEQGSWVLRSNDIYSLLCSGVYEGFIFEGYSTHSEDYGNTFVEHSLNGVFGELLWADISENNKGYTITHKHPTDSLCFFVSNNNFNDNELRYVFTYLGYGFYFICAANENNGIYFYNTNNKELLYSGDEGYNWTLKNTFTCPNLPIKGISGGRQVGELYLIVEYIQFMGYVSHTYIYHSLDYGETFTVHHPVAIGDDPVYANFEASDTLDKPPFEVQFNDLSSNVVSWEWDFDNDGVIDSYEQNPTHTYTDTGYYSVSLKITGPDSSNTFVKENYIHVQQTTGLNEIEPLVFDCYPNPFKECITFNFSSATKSETIKIFDINGKLVKILEKSKSNNKIVWDGKDYFGSKCKTGIYYISTNSKAQSQKIILID